jgi:regulator of cell morphogenesis and NO signaling
MIDTKTQVAKIAREHPSTVRVFQRHGIDFCCGGKRPLDVVCHERGIAPDLLLGELSEACREPGETDAWDRAPLRELIAHIVSRYHGAVRRELPILVQLADKVAGCHGEHHPELAEVRDLLVALHEEMLTHMGKEEQILFPLIERLEDGSQVLAFPLDGPVAAMEDDHEQVARILARIRSLTSDFTPPTDACNSFRGLYQGAADLEADTHVHIHLENNVLFPRAQELEDGDG